MKKFREYISEEVVPSALVANGTIDIDNEDVRASINLALAKVTSDGAITPYIALNRISKALSYFHIILPKRIYLEGAKGVEVHEIRQFGHKMGMTDQGEFVHEVPGKYYLFMQYNMNSPMPYGGQLAYPNMGGTFRVMAKVVDKVELDRLVSMAELALAEECDAEMQQKRAKMLAPHETMHDVTSDEKKKGNKEAVADSEKGLDEAKAPWEKEGNWSKQMKRQEREFRRASTRTKVKLNPEKEISHTVHDVGPGGKKTLSQSGKMKVKDLGEGWVAISRNGPIYDKFGDVNPTAKFYGRKRPVNKPGDAEPGAGDTYKGSKQGGKTRFAKSVKEDKDPCWKGYEMVGMKNKRGRKVPNCVPVEEGRMPASVIKHKQKLANMTPEEKAKKFAGKSEEELKSMARRHGYGKDSTEYSKHVKEEQVEEAKKEKPHWEKYPIYTATGRYKPPQEVIDKYHPEHLKKKTTKTVKKDVKEEHLDEVSHKLALKAMKKSEKRADDEYEADQASDRLSDYKTHEDRAKRLRGHMRKKFGNDKPGRGNTGKYTDRLGDQGGDGRLGVYSVNTHGKRAGLPPKEQVNRLKSNIKFSLGKHHKPNLPEETQIDEISQQLTGRYRSLASTDLAHRTSKALRDYQADKPVDKKNRKKSLNRVAGIRRADKRFQEETQLDEVSKKLARSYIKRAKENVSDLNRATPALDHFHATAKTPKRRKEIEDQFAKNMHKLDNRKAGIEKAKSRLKEEQLDELSTGTLVNYMAKSGRQQDNIERPYGFKHKDNWRSADKEKYEKREKGRKLAHKKLTGKAKVGTQLAKHPYMEETISEKAPPGAKFERMVKHIKAGYAKDGELTKKEKSIAFATAWKAKKRESED